MSLKVASALAALRQEAEGQEKETKLTEAKAGVMQLKEAGAGAAWPEGARAHQEQKAMIRQYLAKVRRWM